MRKLSISKINLIDIHFGQLFGLLSSVTIENKRNTHKLFEYDVAVTKLSCLIVFIVICTNNFWKANMEQFYKMWSSETQDIKTKIIDRLNKQLNVMQTTHLQQPDHSLNERHTTHNTSVLRESQTLNAKYTLQSYFDKVGKDDNK